MIKMNKIFRNILSLAVISASFVSCAQVDTIPEEELAEQKKSTAITVKLPDWPTTRTVVFATNTLGTYNKVFTYDLNVGNKLTDVPVGLYKFYVITRGDYDYENFDFFDLSKGSQYYGDVTISCKTAEYGTSDEGVKRVLSGKYVSRNSGEIIADSTMLLEVKLGQEVQATFQKPYKLTTQYTVSGSITSSRSIQNTYVEICDIVAKKKANGTVVGSRNAKCVLAVGGAVKNLKREFEQTMIVLGAAPKGTANIYVRFYGDDQSTTPEQKSVQYTVENGILKLGDITF